MNDHFMLLARFNRWVNSILYQQVARLDEPAYRGDAGLFFKSVHKTLNHLLLVDRAWLARIRGEKIHGIHSLDQVLFDDFPALQQQRVQTDRCLELLVQELSPSDLSATIRFTGFDGNSGELKTDIILLTLFNHQTHHRGQVNAVLTRNGIIPPDADLPDFLESGLNNLAD